MTAKRKATRKPGSKARRASNGTFIGIPGSVGFWVGRPSKRAAGHKGSGKGSLRHGRT